MNFGRAEVDYSISIKRLRLLETGTDTSRAVVEK